MKFIVLISLLLALSACSFRECRCDSAPECNDTIVIRDTVFICDTVVLSAKSTPKTVNNRRYKPEPVPERKYLDVDLVY